MEGVPVGDEAYCLNGFSILNWQEISFKKIKN